jgi:integrase
MSEPIISIWSIGTGKDKRWVCQARLRRLGQKPITVQRRHPVKSVAYERATAALEALRAPKSAHEGVSVEAAISRYLVALEGTIKETTIGEYAYQLGHYFGPHFGAKSIDEVSPDDVRRLLRKLLDRGLSVATANTIRTRISGLYEFLRREEITEKNPAALVKPFRATMGGETLVREPWDLSEVRDAVKAAEFSALHLFLVLCLFTGLRRGEAAALRWGDVDEAKKTIEISKTAVTSRAWKEGTGTRGTYVQEPKTRSSKRTVYCSDEVMKALYKSRRRFAEQVGRLPGPDDPLIYKDDGSAFVPSSLRNVFVRFCSKNNLRQIRLHDLRHTSAVIALEAGIPLEAVSEGLGHSGLDITKRIYAPKVAGLGIRYATQLDAFISETDSEADLLTEEVKNA